jgi:hypothetical protein
MRILAFLASLLAVSASTKNCNTNSVFSLDSAIFTPESPVAGDNTTLTISYTNPGSPVSGGTATNKVSLNYIPLSPTEQPLCENTVCPIPTGTTTQSSSSAWPDVKGLVVMTLQWTDDAGQSLLCVQVNINSNEDAPAVQTRLPY